ncbi:MAG: GGDEF domain-containing protein [Pseudomonadota bacterium]
MNAFATFTCDDLLEGAAPALIRELARDLSARSAPTAEMDPVAVRQMMIHLADWADLAEAQLREQRTRLAHLETLSVTDELTGLLNRRGFLEVLERTVSTARRYSEGGLLAYIDLNRFKAINDTHGHHAGDRVLSHVADLLRENTRRTDYLARLGGDEFAIIFVRAHPTKTLERVARLSEVLNSARLTIDGAEISIHASIGTERYDGASSTQALIARADAAMYQEKRTRQHLSNEPAVWPLPLEAEPDLSLV